MAKEIIPEVETFARIKVVGIGGSGKNALNHMISNNIKGVEFISINTDAQDLHHTKGEKKIHIGKNVTRGLGTGMNPELGARAAEETKEEIQDTLQNADLVFIAGGEGGGTLTGAAPVVARIARELGALTVGVVTRPFSFEGSQRGRIADQGLEELRKEVDALIIIPNDRIFTAIKKETSLKNAFRMSDEVLRQAVEGISELITQPGLINLDFADIRAVLNDAGSALMGVGYATGENRAVEAAKAAINSPLLDVSVTGAQGILFAISGGEDLAMMEIKDAAEVITESVDKDARIIFGTILDDSLKKGQVKITVIATGFPPGTGTSSDSSASLFGINKKDKEAPQSKESKKDKPDEKKDTKSDDKKKEVVPEEEDDAEWGAVPSFLRRKR